MHVSEQGAHVRREILFLMLARKRGEPEGEAVILRWHIQRVLGKSCKTDSTFLLGGEIRVKEAQVQSTNGYPETMSQISEN